MGEPRGFPHVHWLGLIAMQEDAMQRSERQDGRARIKVIGSGGGGGNAVNRMISAALKGVEFIAVNTDMQALERCNADIKVNIGRKLTRGLGSGGDWTKGRDAADESRAELTELVKDADMVFITAGMGGGTAPAPPECWPRWPRPRAPSRSAS